MYLLKILVLNKQLNKYKIYQKEYKHIMICLYYIRIFFI